jgi:hypothetical protein
VTGKLPSEHRLLVGVQRVDHGGAPDANRFDARWIAARMRWYVAHRQILPAMARSMSRSLDFGFFSSNATADMICPDWQ